MQRFILTAALFACLTLSQNLTQIEALPPCGQTCINNMLGQAKALGCPTTDYICLCKNMNFGFGVRDCSVPVCAAAKPPVDPTTIISVGMNFCSEAEAAAATGASVSTVAATVVSGTTTGSSAAPTGSSSNGTASGSNGTTSSGSSGISGTNGTSSTNGTSGTSGTNGTSGGLLGGGKVITTTNSVGSTITSTMASSSSTSSSSSSSPSSSSSGSGTSTSATSSPSPTKAAAGRVAAGGLVGLAGLAAYVLL